MASRPTKAEQRAAVQAKLAAARAAEARKQRQRRLTIVLAGAVAIIVVVAGGIVIAAKTRHPGHSAASGAASSTLTATVQTIPLATYNAVGTGSVTSLPELIKNPTALTADGKPRVLYIGAEFCPYCAAERWSVVAALGRFGLFTGLGTTSSSASDIFPNTATLSFHGATYGSSLLSFSGYETETNTQAPLDSLPAADQATLTKLDAPPYIDAKDKGSIPFIDYGGKFLTLGASYSPQLLAGKTQAQIAAAMTDPSSAIAKAIDGNANIISAALCSLTNGAPTDVCSSSGVQAGVAALAKAS